MYNLEDTNNVVTFYVRKIFINKKGNNYEIALRLAAHLDDSQVDDDKLREVYV